MASDFLDQALKNINEGLEKVKDAKGRVIAPSVADALRDFCRQEPAFAQTVAEDGGFDKCIADVVKGVGSSISDLDCYRRAVKHYFPSADVRMQLTIEMTPETQAEKPAGIVLDFSDLFF